MNAKLQLAGDLMVGACIFIGIPAMAFLAIAGVIH